MKAPLLVGSALVASIVTLVACGGKTANIGSGPADSGASGRDSGTGSGSGTYVGSGSGSGTYIGSGSGSGTYIGSGSGSGCDADDVPQCPWCNGEVPAICMDTGWECPPPPPCVPPPPDAGFEDVTTPPLSDAGSPALQCGARTCDAANTYCVIQEGEPPPNGTSYACVIYPPECGPTPSCACLNQNANGCACTEDSAGGLTLTCSAM